MFDSHLLGFKKRLHRERRATELATDRAVTYGHRHWGTGHRNPSVFAKARPRANDFFPIRHRRCKAHPRRYVRFGDEAAVRWRGATRLFDARATRMHGIENANDALASEVCSWLPRHARGEGVKLYTHFASKSTMSKRKTVYRLSKRERSARKSPPASRARSSRDQSLDLRRGRGTSPPRPSTPS